MEKTEWERVKIYVEPYQKMAVQKDAEEVEEVATEYEDSSDRRVTFWVALVMSISVIITGVAITVRQWGRIHELEARVQAVEELRTNKNLEHDANISSLWKSRAELQRRIGDLELAFSTTRAMSGRELTDMTAAATADATARARMDYIPTLPTPTTVTTPSSTTTYASAGFMHAGTYRVDARNGGALLHIGDEETVAVPPDSSVRFRINGVAQRVWLSGYPPGTGFTIQQEEP